MRERITSSVNHEISSLGLDQALIAQHQRQVQAFLAGDRTRQTFSILDTCRRDNGRIMPLLPLTTPHIADFAAAAFIPAAGAASRYCESLEQQRHTAQHHWLLPEEFAENMRQCPKALFPCKPDGTTFLELKSQEHEAIAAIKEQIFITPEHMQPLFEGKTAAFSIPTHYREQGPRQSTLRFDSQGAPYRDKDGQLSIVPAGHGALLPLLPEMRSLLPAEVKSLFIRNIDNVCGTDLEFIATTETFLGLNAYLLEQFAVLRNFQQDLPAADRAADSLLQQFPCRPLQEAELKCLSQLPRDQRLLWELMFRLFHLPLANAANLGQILARPLHLVGMVPNAGTDFGGAPVLIRDQQGCEMLLSLEFAHATPQDQERILKNPAYSTHFNPVFLCTELQPLGSLAAPVDFSLVVEKQFEGRKVYYVETILYEHLINSAFANVVLVDLPRSVFKPHKTIDDTVRHNLSDL
jgi:hypothetical protein